jgi:beta-lactamase family protein
MVHSSDVQHAPIAELVPGLGRLAVDAMADWNVPGAAIAVVQDGKVALTTAYGQRDVEANLPVTAATQFMIASITKSRRSSANNRHCLRIDLTDLPVPILPHAGVTHYDSRSERAFTSSLRCRTISIALRISASPRGTTTVDAIERNRALNSR